MDITELFRNISVKMRADFEESRTAFSHSGLKGTAFENTVKSFLRAYLPEKLGICSGQLIDASGCISKQLDIIIYDAHGTPVLKQSGDLRVIPVECAYSVIEVKAHLTTEELERAYANMRSVRELRKTAFVSERPGSFIKNVKMLYDAEWSFWPINYFLFAFSSIDPFVLCKRHKDLHQDTVPHERIDLVCILDKGVILNTNEQSLLPLPGKNTRIGFKATEHSLLLFYTLVSQMLNQAAMPPFMFPVYLTNIKW